MEIRFASAQIAKLCNSGKHATGKLGPAGGKRLRQRMEDIAAAPNLAVLKQLPGRAHPMRRGERADRGEWTVDLDHPRRLTFIPDHAPLPLRDDGGLDLLQVTAVCILEVVDTHDDP